MDRKKQKAMDNFASGGGAMHVASTQLGLPAASVKVAGAHGVGTALAHARTAKAASKAKRQQSKAARRRNR